MFSISHSHDGYRRVTAGCLAVGLLLAAGLSASPDASAASGCRSGGRAAVPGDVNGDGHAEIAVGEPGAVNRSGAVHVFYGQASGLVTTKVGTALDDQYLSQDTAGVPDVGEENDSFGAATVFGDFDSDGCADLVVAASGENDGEGSITVLRGTRTGITATGARTYTTAGLFGVGSPNERFGGAFAVGDFNADGFPDLATSAPGRSIGEIESAGGVAVLYGSRAGLNRGSIRPVLVTRESLLRDVGVPPGPSWGDTFGRALAAGDFDGDGVTELAVGAPGYSETYQGGSVQTISFDPDGRVASGQPDPISQATEGVPNDDEEGDSFGTALAAGDVDGDGRADLAVGVPGEDCTPGYCDELWGKGAVTLLRGSATGLTATGSQEWTQDSTGVDGEGRVDDAFGYSVAMGHFDVDRRADLAIGAHSDWIGEARGAGSVTFLLGASSGLTTHGIGGQQIHQDTPGIGGVAEESDRFGQTLVAAPVQNPGQDTVVIGAPNETVRGVTYTGQIHVLPVGRTGPKASGSQTLHLDSPGVKGKASASAGFGRSLA